MDKEKVFEYKILYLTKEFYENYPRDKYPEVLQKETRAYNCILIQSYYGYYIAIPYRTQMNHNNGYHFKNSERSKRSLSGLDYSKLVIINDINYLSKTNAIIDTDEYKETRDNIFKIVNDVQKYINKYKEYFQTEKQIITNKSFDRKYKFSTLKYFHTELSIQEYWQHKR